MTDIPADATERLDELQAEIDEVRRRVDDPLGDGDRSFVDDGDEEGHVEGHEEEAGEDNQPVDDTGAEPD